MFYAKGNGELIDQVQKYCSNTCFGSVLKSNPLTIFCFNSLFSKKLVAKLHISQFQF